MFISDQINFADLRSDWKRAAIEEGQRVRGHWLPDVDAMLAFLFGF
jgi:phage baseplate assembly protein gpV